MIFSATVCFFLTHFILECLNLWKKIHSKCKMVFDGIFYTLKRFHICQMAYSYAPPEIGHIFRIITNSRQLGLVKILNLWNTSFIEYIMASVALSY